METPATVRAQHFNDFRHADILKRSRRVLCTVYAATTAQAARSAERGIGRAGEHPPTSFRGDENRPDCPNMQEFKNCCPCLQPQLTVQRRGAPNRFHHGRQGHVADLPAGL